MNIYYMGDNLTKSEFPIKVWNEQYNDLEHCGLNGKTPNEMLKLINH